MSTKRLLLFSVALLVLLSFCIRPVRRFIINQIAGTYRSTERMFKPTGKASCKDCNKEFDDDVKTHELAYAKEGIREQEELADLEELEKQGTLVRINDNALYTIQELTHSQPLLLSKAKKFLTDLGAAYKKKCEEEGLEYVPFEISSVTRSKKSVRQLMRSNVNAIPESHHMKGKTFDISYVAFYDYGLQYKKFVAALAELKMMGQ
ncbi:MAG: DUF5715 family protein [Bacteroidota bacterium]